MRLEDAGDLERACARLQGLATADTPFGVLFLVADATCLDREAQRFATAIRRLPGRRARFGAWCRAIAYVFDPPRHRFAARAHLRAAPFVFGTRVLYDHGMNESTAWIASCLPEGRRGSWSLRAPAAGVA